MAEPVLSTITLRGLARGQASDDGKAEDLEKRVTGYLTTQTQNFSNTKDKPHLQAELVSVAKDTVEAQPVLRFEMQVHCHTVEELFLLVQHVNTSWFYSMTWDAPLEFMQNDDKSLSRYMDFVTIRNMDAIVRLDPAATVETCKDIEFPLLALSKRTCVVTSEDQEQAIQKAVMDIEPVMMEVVATGALPYFEAYMELWTLKTKTSPIVLTCTAINETIRGRIIRASLTWPLGFGYRIHEHLQGPSGDSKDKNLLLSPSSFEDSFLSHFAITKMAERPRVIKA